MSLDFPAIEAWNAANERARREYAAHPIASCAGMVQVDGERVPCERMTATGFLCSRCERDRAKAAGRMAVQRRKRREYQRAYRARMTPKEAP